MKQKENIVLCFYNKTILSSYALLMEKINEVLRWDYNLFTCRSGRSCIDFISNNTPSCSTIILETQIPWELYSNNEVDSDKTSLNNMLRLITEINNKNPLINIILVSKSAKSLELAHKAPLRELASNYLKHVNFMRKHINRYVRECIRKNDLGSVDEIKEVEYIHEFTQAIIEMRNRYFSDIRLQSKVKSFDELKKILIPKDIEDGIKNAASSQSSYMQLATALLVGPKGIGKTSISKIIQSEDPQRKGNRFVEANMQTIPPDLVAAELFGYRNVKKFSALKDKLGLIQQADKGILFIDDITCIPLDVQEELIQVIQNKSILRLNTRMRIPVDTKIIASSNSDLSGHIAAGKFKKELYDLFKDNEIKIPSLSERPNDIVKTLKFYCQKYDREVTNDVIDYFITHPPKENIREIKTTIEELARTSSSKLFNITDLLKTIKFQKPLQEETKQDSKAKIYPLLFKKIEHIATIGAHKDNYEYSKELIPFFDELLNTIGEKQFALSEHVHLDNVFKGFRKYIIYLYYLKNRDKLFGDFGLAKILGLNDVSIRKIMPKKTIYQILARKG